jgi:hypothetical protein
MMEVNTPPKINIVDVGDDSLSSSGGGGDSLLKTELAEPEMHPRDVAIRLRRVGGK